MTDQRVHLNVGGRLFSTTKSTLENVSGYFRSWFGLFPIDYSKTIFIDRDGDKFYHVLELMRDTTYDFPYQYKKELEYFQIDMNDEESENNNGNDEENNSIFGIDELVRFNKPSKPKRFQRLDAQRIPITADTHIEPHYTKWSTLFNCMTPSILQTCTQKIEPYTFLEFENEHIVSHFALIGNSTDIDYVIENIEAIHILHLDGITPLDIRNLPKNHPDFHLIDGDWIRTKKILMKLKMNKDEDYFSLKFILRLIFAFKKVHMAIIMKDGFVSNRCKLIFSHVNLCMAEYTVLTTSSNHEEPVDGVEKFTFDFVSGKSTLDIDFEKLKNWRQFPRMICIDAKDKNGENVLPIQKVIISGDDDALSYEEDMLIHDKYINGIPNTTAPIYTITFSEKPFDLSAQVCLTLKRYSDLTIVLNKKISYHKITVFLIHYDVYTVDGKSVGRQFVNNL